MLNPAGEMVLVRELEADTETKSGIILTSDLDLYFSKGEVLAVGPGEKSKNGTRMTPDVEVGDTVVYTGFGGESLTVDGEELKLIREADIVAKEIS